MSTHRSKASAAKMAGEATSRPRYAGTAQDLAGTILAFVMKVRCLT